MSDPLANDACEMDSITAAAQVLQPRAMPSTTQEPQSSTDSISAISKARNLDELERIRRCVLAVGEAAYHWNVETDKITWSEGSSRVLGCVDSDTIATGRGFADMLDPDNFTNRYETVMCGSEIDQGEGVYFSIEYLFRPNGRGNNYAIWLEDCGRWYAGKDGRPGEVFGIVRQIDERHERDQHLQFLGNCDPLTGMMNRGRMTEALSETLALVEREGGSCAFLVAAISNLPVVNDAYGFDIADEVIIAVGRRLRQVVRTGDAIGRFSGSKFGVILTNCSEDELAIAAERFLSVARESVIETDRGPVWAMLSIGGLMLPAQADSANAAMARAEEALTEAKRQPSDTFIEYKPSQERISVRGLNARCAAEIVSGLREDRFTLAYQPIVKAADGEVALHEGLLRMHCDDGDTVEAVHLIPIAEKLGLVRLIDRTVMGLAIDAVKASPDAVVSLNVSGTTATDQRWFGQLAEMLSENLEITERLMIEITETVALNDLDQTTRFIDKLRELGCRVAIDDFGAGYTSFRNLKVLNVDMVKIDGSFCERLAENRDNQYFVRSLIDLARKFELETIAEWVQHEEDAELLREWGIDYLQGNLFGAATANIPWAAVAATGEESLPSHEVFDTSLLVGAATTTTAFEPKTQDRRTLNLADYGLVSPSRRSDDRPDTGPVTKVALPELEGKAADEALAQQTYEEPFSFDKIASPAGPPATPASDAAASLEPAPEPVQLAAVDPPVAPQVPEAARTPPEPVATGAEQATSANGTNDGDLTGTIPAEPDMSRLKTALSHLDGNFATPPETDSRAPGKAGTAVEPEIDLAGAIAERLGSGSLGAG